jgi:hypothetical protein
MFVRNLKLGETLPDELKTGYERGQCDPKWIWVCEHEGTPIGILITAPAHIAVILVVIKMAEGCAAQGVGVLLTEAFKEMSKRGYRGYMVWFGENQVESQLLRMVESTGGGVLETSMSLCYGWFDRKAAA